MEAENAQQNREMAAFMKLTNLAKRSRPWAAEVDTSEHQPDRVEMVQ